MSQVYTRAVLLYSLAFAAPLDDLRAAGCLACHPDGGAGVGPALAGRVGATESVLVDGEARDVTIDEAYVRRALTTPNAEIVAGFPPSLMPAVTDPAQVDTLTAAILALTPPARPSPLWWVGVALGALGFTGGHLLLSATKLRARLGENGFASLYSLVVAAGLGLLVWAWSNAPYVPLWPMTPWSRWVPFLVMPFVMIAQVAGYTTMAPTIYGMADKAAGGARGIHRITRHPANITSSIWAAAHLLPNGDLASLGLFGSVLVLGIAGSLHIDARRAAADPVGWARYAAETSVIPFAAILAGRNRLDLRELGAPRILGGLLLYAGVLWVHPWLIGASPWPW